jgi:hypothetical protein
MDQRADYADRLPPCRVPSLRVLFNALVVFVGLGATAYLMLFIPPAVPGSLWRPQPRPLIVEWLDGWL